MSDCSTDKPALHALLADDDHALRMLLGKILRTLGLEVDYAENGKRALELFLATPERYSMIITDICMPEVSGCELIRVIRKHNADIPIIAITGYAEPNLINEIESLHARLYEKPIRMPSLESYIRSIQQRLAEAATKPCTR